MSVSAAPGLGVGEQRWSGGSTDFSGQGTGEPEDSGRALKMVDVERTTEADRSVNPASLAVVIRWGIPVAKVHLRRRSRWAFLGHLRGQAEMAQDTMDNVLMVDAGDQPHFAATFFASAEVLFEDPREEHGVGITLLRGEEDLRVGKILRQADCDTP